MARVYLDACSIIYLIEAVEPFHSQVIAELEPLRNKSESRIVTSRLSMLECRVQPVKNADEPLLAAYDAFFSAERLIVVEIDARVIDSATRLRAAYGFRTPDAIHLAMAIEEKTDTFLTGDSSIKRCREVNVKLLLQSSSQAST
jgi:predicted nucleic acid-binding protein